MIHNLTARVEVKIREKTMASFKLPYFYSKLHFSSTIEFVNSTSFKGVDDIRLLERKEKTTVNFFKLTIIDKLYQLFWCLAPKNWIDCAYIRKT